MDIKEIMQSNTEYSGNNRNIPQILKANAQKLCWEYNQTRSDEGEKRREILHRLFGKCSELTFIEPSFRCDYGFNIFIHGQAVVNYRKSPRHPYILLLVIHQVNSGKFVYSIPDKQVSAHSMLHSKENNSLWLV